jgi:hypothetical protein
MERLFVVRCPLTSVASCSPFRTLSIHLLTLVVLVTDKVVQDDRGDYPE